MKENKKVFILSVAITLNLFAMWYLVAHSYENGYKDCQADVRAEQDSIRTIIDSMLDADAEGKFQDEKIIILTQ